jgi:hypothetical protein
MRPFLVPRKGDYFSPLTHVEDFAMQNVNHKVTWNKHGSKTRHTAVFVNFVDARAVARELRSRLDIERVIGPTKTAWPITGGKRI